MVFKSKTLQTNRSWGFQPLNTGKTYILKKNCHYGIPLNHGENAWAVMEELVNQAVDELFNQSALWLFNDIVVHFNNSCTFDLKIFDCYTKIINCYKDCIYLYNQNIIHVTNPEITVLVEGLADVLSSQIAVYDDNFNTNPNPVLAEKKEVYNTALSLISDKLAEAKNCFLPEENFPTLQAAFLNNINRDDFSQLILNDFLDRNSEKIYNCYKAMVLYCNSALNDLFARKYTALCYELLKKEQEFLSSIIVVQIEALEKPMLYLQNSLEAEFVAKTVNLLQEGHQVLGKEVNDLNLFFKEYKPETEYLTSEEFSSALSGFLKGIPLVTREKFSESAEKFLQEYNNFKINISQALPMVWEKETKGINFKKCIYELQKSATDCHFLLNEILGCFTKTEEYIKQNRDEYSHFPEYEIISGIADTVKIKTESLREQKKLFQDNCTEIIEKLQSENIPYSREDYNLSEQQILQDWPSTKTILNNILEPYIQQRQKIQANYTEQTENLCKELLIDCILFEIRTFEEIINYSVVKLEESSRDAVKDLVDFIHGISKSLEMILKKNDINPLKPKPHEKFNAKEHMILIAQNDPEYKRGEIIKLMNTGYVQGEKVLLRANVTAAK